MRSEAQVVITNPTGLHARPAVKLAQLAAGFDANVEVRAGDDGEWVRARSTARVMKLKAGAQSTIHFRAEGSQAADALSALVDFVRRDFDEGPAAAAETPGEPAARAEGTSQGGRAIPAVVASPGLAIGILHMPASTNGATRQPGDASEERAAFDGAVARTIERLRLLADESRGLARDVIGFQIGLLEDEEFLGPVWSEIDAGLAADRAWAHHLAREIADYESGPTSYLRERAADLRDLRDGVATAFAHDAHSDTLPEQCVVITDELTPSRFLELDRSRVVAVATRSGSPASHVAMLARAHGVPMLVQLACAPGGLAPGEEAIVDAEAGRLVLGGTLVRVLVNVDDPAALAGLVPSHCDGIGLTRTEFLFHGATDLPDEQTQLDCYRRLVAWARGRPVTVRTLDAGGDKPIPGLTIEGESNPFLGLRGVRLSLSHPEIFTTQLRALARAAAGGDLKVMLPMVTKPDEIDETRRLLSAEVQSLHCAGIDAAMPRLGMMVEVPAAALTVETFDADFFSIGTNDLTQYVLAAGRDSTAVAHLLDPLHPAVLELIARVADACARTGREMSVCGEMAAQPECLRALLDAGVRAISVPPAALASTKASVAALR